MFQSENKGFSVLTCPWRVPKGILAQARYALASGEDIEKWFDVDAFARTALLYELSYSDSGFHYSSTFFVLPAGETRFRPGPVWDFDLTWGYYRTGVNASGAGVKNESGWLPEFYSVPAFAQKMQAMRATQRIPQDRIFALCLLQ